MIARDEKSAIEHNEHQLAYASFGICGDSVEPEFWTRCSGIRGVNARDNARAHFTPAH
jgi:hypothetical protein